MFIKERWAIHPEWKRIRDNWGHFQTPHSWGRPIPFFKEFGRKLYVNAEDYKDYLVTENTTLALELPYNTQIMPYLKITAPSGKKITVKADNYDDNLYDTKGVMMSYYTKEGYQEYEFISWINGETMFYSVPAGVTVHELGYRETGYNTEFKASFQCKDEFLNKLWLKSQRTLYIISEHFIKSLEDLAK